MGNVNVTVFVPGSSVATMADELADGSVAAAVEAAIQAYVDVDSDGQVPVLEYTEDFDNAVDEAVAYASTTPGRDLLVIVTDTVSNDRAKAERVLASLKDDFVVIVPVSNQDDVDTAWLTELDDDSPAADLIDVVTVAGLRDRETAYAEVGPWVNAA